MDNRSTPQSHKVGHKSGLDCMIASVLSKGPKCTKLSLSSANSSPFFPTTTCRNHSCGLNYPRPASAPNKATSFKKKRCRPKSAQPQLQSSSRDSSSHLPARLTPPTTKTMLKFLNRYQSKQLNFEHKEPRK